MGRLDTLIVGLGNPILGDDGVGWKVAEALRELGPGAGLDAEVDCVASGGLDLMERLQGYEHAILVDAMKTGSAPGGTVSVFSLEELADPSAGHSSSAHDASLLTALEAGRRLGLDLPETVTVVAIEAATVHDFSEQLSPAVADAVPRAVQAILALIQPSQNM